MSALIDHVCIRVSDVPVSRGLYEAALTELDFEVLHGGDAYVGFARGGDDDFYLKAVAAERGMDRVTTGAHIAFKAESADAVDRWYRAALEHGATDNGPPGVRAEYSDHYYGAFVIDLDGNNVEAVFHSPDPIRG